MFSQKYLYVIWIAFGVAVVVGFLSLAPAIAQTPSTTRVSVASDGTQGIGPSEDPAISADGRFVAFESYANNLVSGDTNGLKDIFVHDRQTGQTERVSVASDGTEGNTGSYHAAISADGRFVAFASDDKNLVPGDPSDGRDIFVRDRQTGQTERVSVDSDGAHLSGNSDHPTISADGRFVAFVSETFTNYTVKDAIFVRDRQTGQTEQVSVASDGTEGNGPAYYPAISADGRFVAFESGADNLVAGDTNDRIDIFVRDRQTGQTERVSISSDGAEGNDAAYDYAAISADGRFVAFSAWANNLVAEDTNNSSDIFVHDRQTGQTERVSISSDGVEGNSWSSTPTISADGRFVTFHSAADNLVSGDTNNLREIFIHDRQTGQTERVSIASDGTEADGRSYYPTISADGRFVAFETEATNLVSEDTNNNEDILVRDRGDGSTPDWKVYLPLVIK